MAVRLQDVKYVDDKSQKLLSGYLRNIYGDDVGDDDEHIIPDLVLNICLLFYFRGDHFAVILNGKRDTKQNFILSDEDMTVKKVDKGFGNLYGKNKIESMSQTVCQWGIKIKNGLYVELGVSADEPDKYFYGHYRLPENTFVCNGNTFIYGTCKVNKNCSALKWNDGDVVDIKLDLKKRNIEYFVNDESVGVMFKDIPVGDDMQYRLVIYMGHTYNNGTCVSIEYFQRK